MRKIGLVHHWLVSQRGGENVFVEICKEYPDADIYTLVKAKDISKLDSFFFEKKLSTSIIGKLPNAHKLYKLFLPLYPLIIRMMKVSNDTEVVISSDASMIKGIRIPKDVIHVCYCHSPPRYIWDLSNEYAESMNVLGRIIFKIILPFLKKFDLKASQNVDFFIANSSFVKERIKRIYGRESKVIYPPVNLNDYSIGTQNQNEEFYLIVSALVPYKRIDIAVEAFNELGKKLVIVGEGSEFNKLKKIAKSNITFCGRTSRTDLINYYKSCYAFIFPGIEDFGITPLEAQACGKPVLAFKGGGALETVRDNITGIFFDEQIPKSLIEAVKKLEDIDIDPFLCRKNAEQFSQENFRSQMRKFINGKI